MSDEQKDAAAQLYNEAKTTDSASEESTAEQAEGGEESQQQEGAQGDQGESQEKPEAEGEQSSDEEKKGEETKEAGAPENYELTLPKKLNCKARISTGSPRMRESEDCQTSKRRKLLRLSTMPSRNLSLSRLIDSGT